ncbi:MAG: response regulator [Thiohalomonadaceae bacterium]
MIQSRQTRLLIVEDNPSLRESLALLLGGEPAFVVVGAFHSAEDALAALDESQPEMMLVDIGLPGMSGIELIARAKLSLPEVEIAAYTISEERDTVLGALKAGAGGYILKGATPRELVEGLLSLRDGGAPMSPRIARAVIREFRESIPPQASVLTAKEKEVLLAASDGLSYKEIAARLCISAHTVHSHIKHIYEKLHARDKHEALLKARRRGIL